jgi:hypothetical protein
LIVCHNRGWWIENYNQKTRAHHDLRKDAVPQHAPGNRVTINLGADRQKYGQKQSSKWKSTKVPPQRQPACRQWEYK